MVSLAVKLEHVSLRILNENTTFLPATYIQCADYA